MFPADGRIEMSKTLPGLSRFTNHMGDVRGDQVYKVEVSEKLTVTGYESFVGLWEMQGTVAR